MELPEEVRRELEKLYRENVPRDAVTLLQMSEARGGTVTLWSGRMRKLRAEGKWERGRKTGDQSYWYWPVKDGQK